jgi:hypothetical protein
MFGAVASDLVKAIGLLGRPPPALRRPAHGVVAGKQAIRRRTRSRSLPPVVRSQSVHLMYSVRSLRKAPRIAWAPAMPTATCGAASCVDCGRPFTRSGRAVRQRQEAPRLDRRAAARPQSSTVDDFDRAFPGARPATTRPLPHRREPSHPTSIGDMPHPLRTRNRSGTGLRSVAAVG